MVRPTALLCLCVGVALTPRGARAQELGRIELPAMGLLDFEEATVEGWVLFEFDPAQHEEGVWRSMGGWFIFDVPRSDVDRGAGMSINVGLRNIGRHGEVQSDCGMRVGFVKDGQEVPHPVLPSCAGFGRGRWHHVAVTWREGRFLRVYFDGELSAERDFPASIVRDVPAAGRIILGWEGFLRQNLLAIDEVRISSIARAPEEFGYRHCPLQPDPWTMLLENFEQVTEVEGALLTTPAVLATAIEPTSFPVVGGRLIDGRDGRAFAFSPQPPQATEEE